ncbi:MAG TPA: Tex-like N-terminal domain-containing protein, partial [Vicinamibacteria bacterium]
MKAADVLSRLSEELSLSRERVAAVLRLLAEGGTVPFIARYRKEATGGLDEVQIRAIEERHLYWTDLEARRETVLAEIESQGKLTPELSRAIAACRTKAELEDLYLPYKPKRRTRAAIARERGLEPLADLMWSQPMTPTPRESSDEDLAGARDICAERISEKAENRKRLRDGYLENGVIRVAKKKAYRDQKTKFDTYASYEEALRAIPSHRYLAIRRGEAEGVLRVALHLDASPHRRFIESQVPLKPGSPWAGELRLAIDDALERLLLPAVEADAAAELKRRSGAAAIEIFAKNLRELLLAPPYGPKAVLGIDPGQRTGCKCAVVDETGKLREHATIHLVQGEAALAKARDSLRVLANKLPVRAVAVGNGTHGRETE